jgi:hypothetical protein
MRTSSEEGARAAGVFRLGGVALVVRLGYGAMRMTGPLIHPNERRTTFAPPAVTARSRRARIGASTRSETAGCSGSKRTTLLRQLSSVADARTAVRSSDVRSGGRFVDAAAPKLLLP